MVLQDSDLLVGVGSENDKILVEDFLLLTPLVFDGEVEYSDEKLEMDEGISREEIADLLIEASQGVVHSKNENNNNNTPPLYPIEEEE